MRKNFSSLGKLAPVAVLIVLLTGCQTSMEGLDKQLHTMGDSFGRSLRSALSDDTATGAPTGLSETKPNYPDNEVAALPPASGDARDDKAVGEEDLRDYVDGNNRIVQRYQGALVELLQAQVILQEALNIDVDRQKAEATATRLAGGVVEKSELERATAITQENNALIAQKLAEGTTLDERGKEKYGEAVPHYALGTLHSALIVPEVLAYANEVQVTINSISSDPLMAIRLVQLMQGATSALYVATELPTLVGEWYNNTEKLITFGNQNDIDVSKAQDTMSQIEL